MQVMLNPGIALSLLIVLSNSIGARSSFRGPGHFGPLPSFSPEEEFEEGSPCQEEDFGFQEACPVGLRRLPPHLLRQQGLQQVGNGQFPSFNEGNKLRVRLPPAFPGHDVDKQRWRSPFPAMQGDPNQQFQMCSIGGRMDMPGIPPNMSPPFPAQNMMPHQFPGLRFPQKPAQLELKLPTKRQFPHLPSQSLRGRSQKFVSEAPTDFQPQPFNSPDVYKFGKEIPSEWGQQCTSHQQSPPHQPFNHHHHDQRPPTTPKPLSCFFDDFKPKYVETVPPPTCPVSPLYEPPSNHHHLPHPSTYEHKSGNYASHHSYDTPPTQHGFPYCKSYQ